MNQGDISAVEYTDFVTDKRSGGRNLEDDQDLGLADRMHQLVSSPPPQGLSRGVRYAFTLGRMLSFELPVG